MLPVCRPLLPKAEQILPYLQQIDEARYYSNGGPLVRQLEERLARLMDCSPGHIVTSANGTCALTQILCAHEIPPKSFCLMPSWTFVATPAAALAAGLTPYFVDVDDQGVLDMVHVKSLLGKVNIGAIILVSHFGAPLDLKPWQDFSLQTGIPIIIDAAASFDSLTRLKWAQGFDFPVMISLHATKVLGAGEGAFAILPNQSMADQCRGWGHFGFLTPRTAHAPGFNAKMSEYTAAVTLASLNTWDDKRAQWKELSDAFDFYISQNDQLSSTSNFNRGWISSYGHVVLPSSITADTAMQDLREYNIETVQWWGKGCHTHPAYAHYPSTSLHQTNLWGQKLLGLPFWIGMSRQDVQVVFDALENVMSGEMPRIGIAR